QGCLHHHRVFSRPRAPLAHCWNTLLWLVCPPANTSCTQHLIIDGGQMTRYAFIGLGNMGLPMVKNLLGAGHQVQVFDLDAGSVEAASRLAAMGSESLSDAVMGADAIITMLPAGPHVRSVYQQLFELVD